MKRKIKIVSIMLIVIMIISTIGNIVMAGITFPTPDDSVQLGNLTSIVSKVLGALRIFGAAVGVIIIAWLGIKYLLASPEGKADYKGNMIPYIVGAVLLMGATWFAKFIFDAVTNVNGAQQAQP